MLIVTLQTVKCFKVKCFKKEKVTVVLAYHCVIGLSNSLEEKGTIFRCHLDFTSNYSFIATIIEQ
jgi:hypothetical protein